VKFTTAEYINTFGKMDYFKFVKIGGVYRWASTSDNLLLNHTDMVEKDELEKVEGAGTIEVRYGKWKIADTYSSTLRGAGAKNFIVTQEISDELDRIIKLEYDSCL